MASPLSLLGHRLVACLLVGLLLFLPKAVYEVRAQTGHLHKFGGVVDPPIEADGIRFHQPSAAVGEIVSLSAYDYAFDTDICRNEDGACPWGGYAGDSVSRVGVSASGGQVGYLDGLGQFVASTVHITHFKVGVPPPGPGPHTATVSATYDDQASMVDPETGATISLYDDPAVSSTASLAIEAHEHDWEPVDNLAAPSVGVGNLTPQPGERVTLGMPGSGSDLDRCLAAGCPFPDGMAGNAVVFTWSASLAVAGTAAGTFGHFDELGQWVPNSQDPSHYEVPNTPGAAIRITCSIDDVPEAEEPYSGLTVGTYDDAARSGSILITVAGSPGSGQAHDWAAVDNLPAPTVGAGSSSPRAGTIVAVSVTMSDDTDTCVAETCSFAQGVAVNPVEVSGWSDGGAGGAFGYLSGNDFTATGDPARVTHYRCPPGASPAVTLTVTVDDRYQGIADPGGGTVDTYDDQPATGSATIEVRAPAAHTHHWTSTGNLADVPVSLQSAGQDVTMTSPREVVSVAQGMLRPDEDTCTAADCSFAAGLAVEEADRHRLVRWADDGGGAFGRLDEATGVFTELSPTRVAEITHYRVGESLGEKHIWMVVDDAASALDPEGQRATTFDDPEKEGTKFAFTVEGADSNGKQRRKLDGDDACG